MTEPQPRTPAPFGRRLLTVSATRDVGAYRVFAAPDGDGPAPRAGQFYMLATAQRWGGGADERPFLPRAFSVLRASEAGLEFLVEVVGPGTERLAALEPGDGLWVTGPLGVGFTPPRPRRRAILCGGGVGIAPLAIWQDELRATSTPETSLLGFRDGAHALAAGLLGDAEVATDDGSFGRRGFVTDLLAAELDRDPGGTVYACGPPPMLEAVRALCAARMVPTQLALESGMACGFGACFGCVVPTRDGGYLRVCVDGPVVDGELLETCLVRGTGH